MKRILLSRYLFYVGILLMLYGFFAIIFQISWFTRSPIYIEGVIFGGIGLEIILGRHDASISFLRKELSEVRNDIKEIRKVILEKR